VRVSRGGVRARARLKAGDLVIRHHRLLKTLGSVLRFDGEDDDGGARVWVRWRHPTTLPNPSLELVDDLDLVEEGVPAAAKRDWPRTTS